VAGFTAYRENLRFHTSIASVASILFIATSPLALLITSGCIEGGFSLGFPAAFYGGCNEAMGAPSGPGWNPAFLILDLVVWYVVSWGILVIRRDRRVRGPL